MLQISRFVHELLTQLVSDTSVPRKDVTVGRKRIIDETKDRFITFVFKLPTFSGENKSNGKKKKKKKKKKHIIIFL
ncbi:Uncharacterized protein APZ42_023162 [Daphnia magna]|uniref:Uncharacterized protein n=1 Tax=Daphnia magna TaxID=35525 RepID=A0A164V899_9CRUS|nr:Uncharacterized protein APZ42_023162 [Daphnia magna]